MQYIESGYRGLSLLFLINRDRILSVVTMAAALLLGAWLGSL